ncbi:MAG: hypothetical protein LKE61_10105 [Erysipelotrichaceae bacterium]|jgi:fructoselysine and glucoselysine-specific PTS system IIA component|uniref:PTS sugar transporter subunit IIA domain-containing protein n=1 Tax=Lactimicrobium massiliense TaxID=2161814 RepID=UPI000D55BB54|nr:PTS mannose transporter subunit IIA [Lactimicrobium massiliense]MCH4021214.1 hypothetical protein [Erysipelotrichaceae bacterium]MCI1325961.1 hypothetical protein [Solobacterium sp.]MCH4043787.1 hypothetical protein [Erysipelotrichaceae bacterium]MCH4121004.1 hypothetical protein [Erysipelotrichaceae bacterium]MCI1362693.1 hypothetical protein [Solobacterium sp.]
MKERKIIIATHGTLADGFCSALKIITGATNIQTLCCYLMPDFNLEKAIDELFADYDPKKEEVFVFTDLLGGSVNNGFIKAMKNKDFHLITNSSLGLLIDFIVTNESVEDLKKKLSSSQFQAIYCNDVISNCTGIDEDI